MGRGTALSPSHTYHLHLAVILKSIMICLVPFWKWPIIQLWHSHLIWQNSTCVKRADKPLIGWGLIKERFFGMWKNKHEYFVWINFYVTPSEIRSFLPIISLKKTFWSMQSKVKKPQICQHGMVICSVEWLWCIVKAERLLLNWGYLFSESQFK